jgi:hypothetical protein
MWYIYNVSRLRVKRDSAVTLLIVRGPGCRVSGNPTACIPARIIKGPGTDRLSSRSCIQHSPSADAQQFLSLLTFTHFTVFFANHLVRQRYTCWDTGGFFEQRGKVFPMHKIQAYIRIRCITSFDLNLRIRWRLDARITSLTALPTGKDLSVPLQ